MSKIYYRFILPAAIPLALIIAWRLAAPILDNPMLLPHPADVAYVLLHPGESLLSLGSLFTHLGMSFLRVSAGFCVGAAIGIIAGLVMGRYGVCGKLFGLFFELFRPIPSLAWVPLLLAWFGMSSIATLVAMEAGPLYPYMDNMKLAMLFIMTLGGFFPVFTATLQGARSVPPAFIESSRVLGATERQIFFKVLLPAAAPGIFTGLCIGITLDWTHLVAAEMLPGSSSGIGYLIYDAQNMGRMDIVIAGIICIGITGAVLDFGLRSLIARKFSWHKTMRQ